MRLPSLDRVRIQAALSFRRFPLVVLLGSAAFLCVLVLVHSHGQNVHRLLYRLSDRALLPVVLGLSLSLAVSLAVERYGSSEGRLFGWAVTLLGLALFGFSYRISPSGVYAYRFWHWMVAAHLLVSTAAYLEAGNSRGFWSFNRALFLRILLASLYSGTLYLGLVVALSAIHHLLGLAIPSEAYSDLWFFLAFVFNTWFFIAGIPADYESLSRDDSYPAGLKVFVQFVLIPLLIVYILILYLYMGKILVIRQWPKGTIGWLVSVVSALGTLSWLLLHPLRHRPEHAWIRFFGRWFFRALFPLLFLLAMALWRRIGEYGITEDRYILLVLCGWMASVAAWFTARPDADIRTVPLSLAGVAILTSFGPWSSFSVSCRSQQHRFIQALEEAGILVHGEVHHVQNVSWKSSQSIGRSLDYLLAVHGIQSVKPVLKDLLKDQPPDRAEGLAIFSHTSHAPKTNMVLEKLGLTYIESWQKENPVERFSYYGSAYTTEHRPIPVTGFDYAVNFSFYWPTAAATDFVVARDTYSVAFSSAPSIVVVKKDGRVVLEAPLAAFISSLRGFAPGALPPRRDQLVFNAAQGPIKVRIAFETLVGTWIAPEKPDLQQAAGWVFLHFE